MEARLQIARCEANRYCGAVNSYGYGASETNGRATDARRERRVPLNTEVEDCHSHVLPRAGSEAHQGGRAADQACAKGSTQPLDLRLQPGRVTLGVTADRRGSGEGRLRV